MRNALCFYFAIRAPAYTGRVYGYKAVADAYRVPRETFRRRLSGPLMGYFGHVAGGHVTQQSFISVGHPSVLLTPIHLALPNTLSFGTPVTVPPATVAAAVGRAPPPPRAPAPVTANRRNGKQFFDILFCFICSGHGDVYIQDFV